MLIEAEEIDVITRLTVKGRYRKEYPNKNSMTVWKTGEDQYTFSFHRAGRDTVSGKNVTLKVLLANWRSLIKHS
ncbi:MAG: hypothetical protein K2O59_01670 [Lachnospiraceae bacterium]|nr:hypothetical protein [Lachnospiraceae bacterium]